MQKISKISTRVLALFSLAAFGVLGLATAAGAEPPVDPSGGAYGDGVGTVQSFVEDTAAGPLFLLAGIVVAIMVGIVWVKKSKTAAS